ncbi:hypothetical protein Pint_11951 [Pistacia integerrima]|uniref:Uncharacterized protein n=1 Tax=Pistacia integerrima TaxID=434235 RepID=A0ACC0XHV7_9ROSI|nr:hypothetical protein Pint_11951 [Pistacia integerrima]
MDPFYRCWPLIAIQRVDSSTPSNASCFTHEPFWVQLHNMPFAAMNNDCGVQLASAIGKVLEVEVGENGLGWGSFLRVKVEVELTKPLVRGRILRIGEQKLWIAFKLKNPILNSDLSCEPVHQSYILRNLNAMVVQQIEAQSIFIHLPWMLLVIQGAHMSTFQERCGEYFIINSPIISANNGSTQDSLPETNALIEDVMAQDWQEAPPHQDVTTTPQLSEISSQAIHPGGPKRPTWKREARGINHINVEEGGGCFATPPYPMICISWNCRGLGNPRIVCELHHWVKTKCPDFVFLMETKCNRNKLELIRNKIGFSCSFVVESRRASGGIAMLWKDNKEVDLVSYTQHHISIIVNQPTANQKFILTGFYGHPDASKRTGSWNLLRELKAQSNMTWLCIGDFNEICHQYEKFGAADRPYRQMQNFREALLDCDLSEIPFNGDFFTWNNGREGWYFTKEKLDKGFGNKAWFELFSDCIVNSLTAWDNRAECGELIQREWLCNLNPNSSLPSAMEGLQTCKEKLSTWSKSTFRDQRNTVTDKLSQLKHLEDTNRGDKKEELQQLKQEIDGLLEEDYIKWKQRAKQQWLKDGDRNTKFFHLCANQHRKSNVIKQISSDDGRFANKPEEVSNLFQLFFQSLFSSSMPERIEDCIRVVKPVITPKMNSDLVKQISNEEVEKAVFNMNGLGSPGPDGFLAIFYQKHWMIIGPSVCAAVKTPFKVSEFRPISLCNVLYKILAKVLANRLQKILPQIISPSQSAFIPDRLITDNAIVAFEVMHTMNTSLKGKDGYMVLKLDMSKAYDRLEWSFLQAVMLKMGFNPTWIKVIMNCLSSVTYLVLINGIPQKSFKPSRGIRQGDPLSPYLFIIRAETLSRLIQDA